MLGELYIPKGKALETAQVVLGIKNPVACNVAMGCRNKCKYCYGDTSQNKWQGEVRFPHQDIKELIDKYFEPGKDGLVNPHPDGVFFSFMTDPFQFGDMNSKIGVKTITEIAIDYLIETYNVKNIATLSKLGLYTGNHVNMGYIKNGMTIVSLDDEFSKVFEPHALPPQERLKLLKLWHDHGEFVWVSMEPYPCPEITKDLDIDVTKLIEQLSFVDLIVFGKWNYNPLANTPQAKHFYLDTVSRFIDACLKYKVAYYIKKDTSRFTDHKYLLPEIKK